MGGLESIKDIIIDSLASLQSHPGYEVATLFLAGLFTWSGVAKLRRPGLAAMAIADFGVVARPRRWHGTALGAFELALGAALVAGQGMALVLGVACFMLLAFSTLVARALMRADSFTCFCFGGEEELSRATLIRNLGLLALGTILWSAWLPTAERVGTGDNLWLTAVIAAAALACAALAAQTPQLLRWNWEVRDHFRARAEECADDRA